jgi:hypothetical protein
MSSQVQTAPQQTQTTGPGPFDTRPAPLLVVMAIAILLSHLDHIHAPERLLTTSLTVIASVMSLGVAQKKMAIR